MNGLEFLQYLCGDKEGTVFHEDEGGNVWFDTDRCPIIHDEGLYYMMEHLRPWLVETEDHDEYCLLQEMADRLEGYEVILPEGVEDISFARRPYYRMRGCPVSAEQARELIRRTDHYFYEVWDVVRDHPDYVSGLNFDNWLMEPNHYPKGYGWVHADGTIGADAITQKYPEISEFAAEWLIKLIAFPYLDLMIAVTKYNEILLDEKDEGIDEKDYVRADEAFYNGICAGIHVSGGKVEVMTGGDAVERYREYADRYESANREIYLSEYYQDHGIQQISDADIQEFLEQFQANEPVT